MVWTAADVPDLSGRVAVVTGASAGLGAQTVRELAAGGATVVMGCRSIEKGEGVAAAVRARVPGAQLAVVRVELASLDSVREAAGWLRERFERIDVLVNNAGTLTRVRSVSVDGFETTFATNHLGHFALTGLVLDLLAPAARVVAVSSRASGYRSTTVDLGDLGFEHREYKPMRVYGQSKLANLLFIFELQRRLEAAGAALVAAAVYPGVATSDFNRNLGLTARILAHPALRPLSRLITQTTEMGALPSLRAATDPGVRGGEYFGPSGRTKGYPVLRQPGPLARDLDLAARLWEESERMTGVHYRFQDLGNAPGR
ncbi:oxidoreductase [Nocardia sp. NBC_01327]|uniref:oxidoreductase n=1 Tax=Nocardia sp. NBC_01327 TaxID=2903593 RepID=UPI002E0FFE3A|nr:oxidoreductase [Nocardia sp. NBC_01327]